MHRDLKSGNIILTKDWVAKVCDFGLARQAPEGGDANITFDVGTAPWMAPEVLMGPSSITYDLSVDVYSFGKCLV